MESNVGQLPQPEKKNILPQDQWRSSYNGVVLTTLEKVMLRKIRRNDPKAVDIKEQIGLKREKLKKYLDSIDQELVENFGIFESKDNPGVRFPYSIISVNNIASRANPNSISSAEKPSHKRIVHVTFRPFLLPPAGGPENNLNSDYDRILMSLPKIKDDPDTEIKFYSLGLPTSNWGSVSKEWIDNLEKGVDGKQEAYGFSQFGSLYAEFLKSVISQDPKIMDNVSYNFYAGSMGTILASETAKQLPQIWDNLKLLLDVPTGVHKPAARTIKLPFVGKIPLSLSGLQVVAGFGTEALLRIIMDPIVKTAMSDEKPAQKALDKVLQKKGILPYESEDQKRLKMSAALKMMKLLVRGTPLDTDDFRSYVAQGMLDPSMFGAKMLSLMVRDKQERFFQKGKRSLGMGINYTHWMDRGRWPGKWIRAIEQYEKLK